MQMSPGDMADPCELGIALLAEHKAKSAQVLWPFLALKCGVLITVQLLQTISVGVIESWNNLDWKTPLRSQSLTINPAQPTTKPSLLMPHQYVFKIFPGMVTPPLPTAAVPGCDHPFNE